MTCNEFDGSVTDFNATYEKILTISTGPTVVKTTYNLNPPAIGRHIIFKKHLTSTEHLGFSEIEVMA